MKKKALGRGLDALFPQVETSADNIIDLSIADIDANPYQPRKVFDEESLQELADSIKELGIIQPILVTRHLDRYRIVAGERRFRAAQIAGFSKVPCIVREINEKEQLEIALIENLQREDLNPMEEAEAVRSLMDSCAYTQEAVAKRLGKSRPAIANLLRLLTLPDDIKQLIRDGRLSAGHGRVLAGVSTLARKRELAEMVLNDNLSVRQLEALASKTKKPEKPPQIMPPEMRAFEEDLHRAFGVRTKLKGNMEQGRVVITYRNREELEALFAAVQSLIDN